MPGEGCTAASHNVTKMLQIMGIFLKKRCFLAKGTTECYH